jgi:hypothetical protein
MRSEAAGALAFGRWATKYLTRKILAWLREVGDEAGNEQGTTSLRLSEQRQLLEDTVQSEFGR